LLGQGALIAVHVILAVIYLLLRWHIVGTASTNVYSSASIAGGDELWRRLGSHVRPFASISEIAPLPAAIAAGMYTVAVGYVVLFKRSWPMLLWSALWVTFVLLGAALHFATAPRWGDGSRMYYLALLGFAIAAAPSLVGENRRRSMLLILVWGVMLALWQNPVNRHWWLAANEIRATARAIAQEVPRIADSDYGLLLLADPLYERVPTFRNAQGAIITSAARLMPPSADALSRLVAFVPMQLNEWHGLMSQPVVAMITKRAGAPAQPTRYYCKEPGQAELRACEKIVPGQSRLHSGVTDPLPLVKKARVSRSRGPKNLRHSILVGRL
jgi:hypothetical protein